MPLNVMLFNINTITHTWKMNVKLKEEDDYSNLELMQYPSLLADYLSWIVQSYSSNPGLKSSKIIIRNYERTKWHNILIIWSTDIIMLRRMFLKGHLKRYCIMATIMKIILSNFYSASYFLKIFLYSWILINDYEYKKMIVNTIRQFHIYSYFSYIHEKSTLINIKKSFLNIDNSF